MKRKEHLIPLERSKKTIYLEKRGREKDKVSFGAVLFAVLGILCFLYCVGMALFIDSGSKFFLMWGGAAVFFGILSYVLANRKLLSKIPLWLRRTAYIGFGIGLLLFFFVEGMILCEFKKEPEKGADYLIVLGAQWKENGPSYVLQKRLDKALEYLEENPDTKVIVSGGQGSNEPVSEAEGMQGYLEQAGIEPKRIFTEESSTNTLENISFSGELLDKGNAHVIIVTNNFHVFRAVKIAEKQGYASVEGLAAEAYPGTFLNNMVREFFGVIKDFLAGNM